MADLSSLQASPPVDVGLLSDPGAATATLWNAVLQLAERIDEAAWNAPTPCAAWSVHDLLSHLSAVQLELDGGTRRATPPSWQPDGELSSLDAWTAAGVAAYADATNEEVLADLRRARDGHVLRLLSVEARDGWDAEASGPIGTTSEAGLLRTRCFDLWVHLQDLRLALDDELDVADRSPGARAAYRYVLDRVPWLSVKRVGFTDGSTMRLSVRHPIERSSVLAVADGRAGWDDTKDPGECAVDADPLALTLLVCGRGEPATWAERGLLTWSGPRGGAFVHHARFF